MATMLKNNQWFSENVTDVDFIRAHEDLTPRGRIHAPISSADILTKFREKATALGIRLVKEQGALKRDGTRFMYLAEVEDSSNPDYALTVGFRQSSDTSLSFSGIAGSNVFICSNGVCNAIIKPSKMRHTIGNVNNGLIDGRIDTVFSRFLEETAGIHSQIGMMKSVPLTDEIVGKFVRALNGEWKGEGEESRFVKNPLFGSSNLLQILAELENPTLNSKDDSSCFRLMNAASYVTTHKMAQRNPAQAMMASRLANNTILKIIDPGFSPLGDTVEVEVVED